MRKILITLVAVIAGYFVFTSFSWASLEFSQSKIEPNDKKEKVKEPIDYYEKYLKELNVDGPKEGESSSKSEPVKKEIKTATIKVVEENITDEISSKPALEQENEQEDVALESEDELAVEVDHSAFGALLKKHVNSKGDVDYKGFKKDEALLDAYLAQLEANPVTTSMSKKVRLSYWINAYNAFTIKLILEHYPVKSITEIYNGKPWDEYFIKLGSVTYSLNKIENEIIRKQFFEPRIHFAVNCAAESCPPLLNDAYYPETLLKQLDAQTVAFVQNNGYNTITETELKVSKIFEWYGEDFGSVKGFIKRYAKIDLTNAKLEFKEYDWSLNEQ